MGRYKQGLKAMGRLLHENRSFSGHEKHCAFLNTRDGAFANISAVSGIDFPEDGRALGPVDWDGDGDLDLWITNRTAPRVRLLINQSTSANGFLSLYLEGDGVTVNRDAVGARVSIGHDKPLIKTKYAGESFLSQSSGWLHFGLGDQQEPVEVSVQWPNGDTETFSDLKPNEFYVIRHGSRKADAWEAPKMNPVFSEPSNELDLPESSPKARIILTEGLPLPNLTVVDEIGKTKLLARNQGPRLLTVWATWCKSCQHELKAFGEDAAALRQAGLQIFALNADGESGSPATTNATVTSLGFPFESATATEKAVRSLDLLQRSVLDRWEPLPVPSSFLIDSKGYVVAIYKGPVSTNQVLSDMPLTNATAKERRDASVPFAGIWLHDPPSADPLQVSSQMIDHAMVPEALDYVKHATALDRQYRKDTIKNSDLADRYLVIATLLRSQKAHEEAIQAYTEAGELNANDVRIASDLGDYFRELRKPTEALTQWQRALSQAPSDRTLREKIGMTFLQLGQAKQAIPHLQWLTEQPSATKVQLFYLSVALQRSQQWRKAIEKLEAAAPYSQALNNLAWIRATHPDAQWRDGKSAIQLASQLCETTQFQNPNYIATLAAAQAEVGQFEKAIASLDRALPMLSPAQEAMRKKLLERKEHFQKGRAYRDQSLSQSIEQ